MTKQSTSSLLMVRPTTFGYDTQTAISNAFQHKPSLSQNALRQQAINEFDQAVEILRSHTITVIVFEDTSSFEKPNAVFPNNWLSTWPDGHVYLYPMAIKSRRSEHTTDALRQLERHFLVTRITDLSSTEQTQSYLESTGVIIFDHI